MNIFGEELKPEEIEVGFTAEESDNDTFWSENTGAYPENLPDYVSIDPETQINIEQPVESEPAEETINYSFEETADADDDPTIEPAIAAEPEPEEITKIENIDVDNEQSGGIFDSETIIIDKDATEEVENIDATEEVELDDDFKKMLLRDIEKSNAQKSKIENEDIDESAIKYDVNSSEIYDIIDDQNAQVTADLLNLQIQKNDIRYNEPVDAIDEPETIANEEEPTAEKQDKEKKRTAKPVKTKAPKKEKKSKKKFILIAASAVAAIFLAIGGYFGYGYYMRSQLVAPLVVENTVPFADKTTDTADSERTKYIDTTATDSVSLSNDTTQADTSISLQDTTLAENKKDTVKEIKKAIKPEPKPTYVAEKKAISVPKPKQSNQTNNVAKNTIPTKPQSVEELYTVQVYASPSREDAELRLNLLKKQNISGTITTQNIKGRTWYRVRFGSFSSLDEARSTISQYGLTQAWPDRIK